MDPLWRYPKATGTHLYHLGVQALTYLDPPVGEEDGAIGVDVEESTCLVQVLKAKGYAVFGGDQGHTPLQPPVGSVGRVCVCVCRCV